LRAMKLVLSSALSGRAVDRRRDLAAL